MRTRGQSHRLKLDVSTTDAIEGHRRADQTAAEVLAAVQRKDFLDVPVRRNPLRS
jgi:hypothetical protein